MSTGGELIALVSLFIFLFQMKLIKDKLTSESAKDYHLKLRSTKIQMASLMLLYVFFVYGLELIIKQRFPPIDWTFVDTLNIIRTISKFFADAYCFVAFMQVFRFFINKKMDANKIHGRPKLSSINKFAVYYTLVQYFLQMIYKLFSIFFWSYYYSSLSCPHTYTADLMNDIIFNLFQPTLNFMICLGLAALFYYQGKAVNQSRKKMNFKLISQDHNRLSPATRLSEFKSGSKKVSKVISINSKEKDMEGLNPPT